MRMEELFKQMGRHQSYWGYQLLKEQEVRLAYGAVSGVEEAENSVREKHSDKATHAVKCSPTVNQMRI